MTLSREKFRRTVWAVGKYATAITAITGLLILYAEMGGPTLALSTDIEEMQTQAIENMEQMGIRIAGVEQFNMDTRALLLNEKWERIYKELASLRYRLSQEPGNRDLRERIINLETTQRLVSQQLKELNGD